MKIVTRIIITPAGKGQRVIYSFMEVDGSGNILESDAQGSVTVEQSAGNGQEDALAGHLSALRRILTERAEDQDGKK